MSQANTSGWTQEEANQALQQIVQRTTTDMEFRRLALRDPNAAVKQVTGKELPPGFKIKVVENQGANLTVVLPDPQNQSGELSDAELEQVAGGGNKCGGSCGGSEACGVSSVF